MYFDLIDQATCRAVPMTILARILWRFLISEYRMERR
jgi:hypothetical protein